MLLNITAYLTHSRRLPEDGCFIIYKYLRPIINHLDEYALLKFANYFSREESSPKEFWEKFVLDDSKLLKDHKKGSYLYTILLNLRLNNPDQYEAIKGKYDSIMPELKKIWYEVRTLDITNTKPSHIHTIVERCLKKNNIEYFNEYFFEYYIDIAIPKYKICFEILGPGHFLYPSKILNGRTYSKQKNLEKLGWSYHVIPFYMQRGTPANIEKMVLSLLPLLY